MDRDETIRQSREQMTAGHTIEAANILLEGWRAGLTDDVMRLEAARTAHGVKSLRHKQVLYQEIGGGEPRFGLVVDERYVILERLSESPGVAIYVARDEREDRDVLLWYLEPLWHNSDLRQGWVLNELHQLHAFRHPVIAPMLGLGAPTDDLVYATIEVPQGNMLSRLIADKGPLPVDLTAGVMVKLLDGLAAAHAAGIHHGSLRLDHLTLGGGHVQMIDLGLYTMIRAMIKARKMTRTGQVPGLIAHLPPEFERGEPPDAAWDVCSAGSVAFEMLTGAPPWGAPEAPRLVRSFVLKMRDGEIPKVRDTEHGAGAPEWVDEVLGRMLARDPAERYATTAEARDAWGQAVGDGTP